MADDSLLKLEKKLDVTSSKDYVLSKFLMKPTMKISEISKGKNYLSEIGEFVGKFKSENNKILNDEEQKSKLNIEEGARLIESNSKLRLRRKKKSEKNGEINKDNENGKKFIELNLNLGILDVKKKEEKKIKLVEAVDIDEKEKEIDLNDNDNEEIPFIKVSLNKKKNNFVNKNLIENVLSNNNINCTEDNLNDNDNIENYPFIDFKEDKFNKEILNFLKENKVKKNKKKKKQKISKDTNK